MSVVLLSSVWPVHRQLPGLGNEGEYPGHVTSYAIIQCHAMQLSGCHVINRTLDTSATSQPHH